MNKSVNILLLILTILLLGGGIYYMTTSSMPMMNHGMNGTSQNREPSVPIGDLPKTTTTEEIRLEDGVSYMLDIQPTAITIGEDTFPGMTYNGSFPGPTLRVQQDSKITFNISNHTNSATMLHPHGIRTANNADGTHLTQAPILPGETYTQVLNFPDPGVYWYHPHLDEPRQQELGLYGTFIVEPKDANYWPRVDTEEVLVLDDILLGAAGTPSFRSTVDYALMGRFGDTMLVNGNPHLTDMVQAGEVRRLYLVNAANTRTFDLSIPGAQMKLVGGDNGAYEHTSMVNDIIIAPSERYVVDVYFPEEKEYRLEHHGPRNYVLDTFSTIAGIEPFENPAGASFEVPTDNPLVGEEMQEVRKYMDTPVDKEISLSGDMSGMNHMSMGGGSEGIEWEDQMPMMNSMSTTENTNWKITEGAKINDQIHWTFTQGDRVKIKITNTDTGDHPMQHPIHLHGNRFVVLKRNAQEEQNLVWKDTVLLKTGETVEILAEMDILGKWMLHCHIAEHLADGMMLLFDVQK